MWYRHRNRRWVIVKVRREICLEIEILIEERIPDSGKRWIEIGMDVTGW